MNATTTANPVNNSPVESGGVSAGSDGSGGSDGSDGSGGGSTGRILI